MAGGSFLDLMLGVQSRRSIILPMVHDEADLVAGNKRTGRVAYDGGVVRIARPSPVSAGGAVAYSERGVRA